jgi:alkylation response protein AidB-like acyl-CoA dehydrogenase
MTTDARMAPEDRKPFADAVERATASLSGPELEAALEEIGWRDALPDYPADAVAILFESQGRARATTSALDAVLAEAGGVRASRLVLPALSDTAAPGTLGPNGLVLDGLALPGIEQADEVVVVASTDAGPRAVTVSTSALTLEPVRGMDATFGLSRVTASGVPESAWTSAPAEVAWDDAVSAGQRALAHELIGLSRSMLTMAREHALTREQFGRPIASFQAVRHKLAESLVAVDAAESAASAAWDSPGPLSASIAKALAGQSARTVAKHAQQVLAGMGFTTEHAFHLYFRRVLVLDHLLGSSKGLTEDLGRQLLASRELPAMLPL